MSEWFPIETAPNDMTILVYYSDGATRLIDADDNDYEWHPYRGQRGPGISCPTHWMPLPEPPEITDARGRP